MKYWSYNEPLVDDTGMVYGNKVITMSEEEIMATYYPYWWSAGVRKYGEEHMQKNYTRQDCIDCWVVVNWAWESEPEV